MAGRSISREGKGDVGGEEPGTESVPGLRATAPAKTQIAVLSSDWHLSLDPPACRAERGRAWQAVQQARVKELHAAVVEPGGNLPLVIPGDLFDDGWRERKCPPELINFAMHLLEPFWGNVFAVPGQHDLPNHSYADVHRSAYWTLVKAQLVQNLAPGKAVIPGDGTLTLHGFPWGFPITPLTSLHGKVALAVIHSYVWHGASKHAKAEKEDHVGQYGPKLAGYTAAAFGDNHAGFLVKDRRYDVTVMNCGTILRRTRGEKDYRPRYGVLFADGHVEERFFQSPEAFLPEDEEAAPTLDVGELVAGINDLGNMTLDFVAQCRAAMKRKNLSPEARRLMVQILSEEK